MAKLTFQEIMERLEFYQNDSGLKDLHAKARDSWYPLFKRTHVAQMPDHATRGTVVAMPSPRLFDLTEGILADFASYSVITTVSVRGATHGVPTQAQKSQADKVERFLTALLYQQFIESGGRREQQWQQLMGPYAVVCPRYCASGYEIDVWDPLSCYFPVRRPPYQPAVMIRDTEMLVSEAKELYGRNAYNVRRGRRLNYSRDGEWGFEQISDDVATDHAEGSMPQGGNLKYGERVRVIWYADAERIYHCLVNRPRDRKSKAEGQVVYEERNTFGEQPAIVVSGAAIPLRETAERMGPALMPVIQTVLNINLSRQMRATRSFNQKPDAFIEMDPDKFEEARSLGLLAPMSVGVAESVEVEASGGPSLIRVGGQVVPWTVAPDPDLDKLEQGWREEQAEYIGAWREPTDPATVADARANTYLTATEAVRRRQTTLLKDGDQVASRLGRMIITSVRARGEPVEMYSRGGEPLTSGQMGAGEPLSLGPKDLDEDFDIYVATKSVTDSEKRMRTEAMLADVANGISTLEEVIETKYLDATAQLKKLAIDAGYRLGQPVMLQHVDMAYRDSVLEHSGIVLPAGAPVGQPAPAPVGASAGGFTPMQPAAIGGAEGGSGAPVGV